MVDVHYLYPRWGAEHVPWPEFLRQVKQEGYQGIEWYPYGEADQDYEWVIQQIQQAGLVYAIVMTVHQEPAGLPSYCQALEQQLLELARLGNSHFPPLFISAQVGREYFSLEQVIECIQVCEQVQALTGVKIYQETHRNKWSYGIHKIPEVLQHFPELKFTLDISHWFCVSESYLEDQQEKLLAILPHVEHLHARVGYTQGSQVPDVSNATYKTIVDIHLSVWQAWLAMKKAVQQPNITISTEFGPPPYLIPTGSLHTDYLKQWAQNLWIKTYLKQHLNLID